MGITGLLKGLQFCAHKRHIRDFSNQSLAVDASSWLHKSVYSISERYVESLDKGHLDPTCVQVATKYIVGRCEELLLHAHIGRIYLVLDGKRCPLKAQTNEDREERRQKNLAEARKYKREGRRDKAEEKYKACIKIISAMANAVAEAVTRRFANDDRVQCIYSPYEADAQLVKLCMDRVAHAVVTEDSDVLVYSASCHFAFPIIYKLERDTGACDVISMEWLVNPDSQQPGSQGGALESVLKSLCSRQSRRLGVGTRLFVQACVLAGCDYCPSKLNGVGLVTAFKLLRDNAHREPGDRFRKVLSSLSKKARSNINIDNYEELLTKSEAVFYYHPVLDVKSRNIIPLLAPLTSKGVNTSELQDISDHHPSLHRFEGDWSFLGNMESRGWTHASAPYNADDSGEKVLISDIVNIHGNNATLRTKKSNVAPVEYDEDVRAVSDILKVINPYDKKRKRSDNRSREPLAVIDMATGALQHNSSNPFSKFSRTDQESRRRNSAGFSMYVNNRQDVRFVKRKFSSGAKQPSYVEAANKLKSSQLQMQTLPPRSHPTSAPERHQVQELEMEYFARCENVSQEAEGSVLNPSKVMALPPMEDVCIDDVPFGNPDLAPDAPASSKYFSSILPTARRVTLEDENSPLYNEFDATYNEFDATYTNGGNFQQEYSSTSFDCPEVEIVLACAIPTNDTPPFGNVDDRYSVSSCEHIASPDHVQSKFRPSFNDFSWAEKHSQSQQGVATPRQEQLTPVVHRQRPLKTYFLGTAAGHQSSPLSVTSPTYTSSALNIHSQPPFKNQTRSRRQKSCRQSVTPKPGAITNFFPVKTPGTNEFYRF